MEKEFTEFMEWMKIQPDQTIVSAVMLRLWNNFQIQRLGGKWDKNKNVSSRYND